MVVQGVKRAGQGQAVVPGVGHGGGQCECA